MNIKLLLAYDGTQYRGWQKTYLGLSIEEVLQQVLETILQHPVELQAASRTDAGVHATGQVANFFTEKSIHEERFLLSVNSLLPKDIRILQVTKEKDHFHPTLNSVGKTYHYELCQGRMQMPHLRFYSWHIPKPLNLEEMEKAAHYFIGEQDFSSFCNVKNNEFYKDKIRHIEHIEFFCLPQNRLKIAIRGKNFLYKMVRNIVGTLVYVGLGKILADQIPMILNSKDRKLAGVSAPAHGLTLHEVHYESDAKSEK